MKLNLKQLFSHVIDHLKPYVGSDALRDEYGALEFAKEYPEKSDFLLRSRLRNLASNYPHEVLEFLQHHVDKISDYGLSIMLHEVSCDAITQLCCTRRPASNIHLRVHA